MISEFQRKLIRNLKGFESGIVPDASTDLVIRDEHQTQVGTLLPITSSVIEKDWIVTSLTNWRQLFMHNFLTQFDATEERTYNWIKNIVLQDDTRILFLIIDHADKLIGNVGLRDIGESHAQLDNVIRGEKAPCKNFMYFSLLTLLKWIYCALDIDHTYLHVFSNNKRAIALYKSVGFQGSHIYGLSQKTINSEVIYEIDPTIQPSDTRSSLVRMEMTKDSFYK